MDEDDFAILDEEWLDENVEEQIPQSNSDADETIRSKRKRKQNRKVSVPPDVWDDDNITKLIAAVETHSCLWNAGNVEYKNRPIRDSAWKSIATDFDISVQQLMVKWQSLRNQYRTALSNAKKTKSGQAANRPPQWKFLSQMAFVGAAEKNQTAPTVSNFSFPSRSQSSLSNRPSSSFSIDEIDDDAISSTPSTSASVSQKQTRTEKSTEEDQNLLSSVQYALGCLQAPSPTENDVQAFGNYVVSELRKVTNDLHRQSIQREILKHMWKLIDNVPVYIIIYLIISP